MPSTITLHPSLDVPTLARIRYPAWLQDLYNKAQLECPTLDLCGSFCLVALDDDWNAHPTNIITTTDTTTTPPVTTTTIRARPIIRPPKKPATTAKGDAFARFVYDMKEFTAWEHSRLALHSAMLTSLGPATIAALNALYPAGTASLSCLDLVKYVQTNSAVTTDEIDHVESCLEAPLANFADFPDYVANLNMHYTFLAKHNHTLPPLRQIKLLLQAISKYDQFQHYIKTYNERTTMLTRTYHDLSTYLVTQFANMPKEGTQRGGNAYFQSKGSKGSKGKGKGKKGKSKGKGKRQWAWIDEPSAYSAQKRARSISPVPSVTPTITHSVAPPTIYNAIMGDDTRSVKSHRSATNQIHSLGTPAHAELAPHERETNPDPDTYFYCYAHGFNLSNAGTQCAKMRNNPSLFTSAMVAATNPNTCVPIGSKRLQRKTDGFRQN